MLRYDWKKKVIVQILLLAVFAVAMLGMVSTEKYSEIIAYQRAAESEWDHLIFTPRPDGMI
ncbi:MAG: hypothetical protein K2N01_03125 [Lachnospiraceae bacterium]|nr:hypothetical protein [Lachnospiraceae bacterium]